MRLESVLSSTRPSRRSLPTLATAAGIGFFVLPLASTPAATRAADSAQAASVQPSLVDPLASGKVTRRFGKSLNPFGKGEENHQGIDIAAPRGTPVLSAGAGTVELATKDYAPAPTAGTVVIVDHGGGRKTFYSHLSAVHVKAGQRVTRGQALGEVDNTGVSTGPHLHFEVWDGDVHVDPATAIPPLSSH